MKSHVRAVASGRVQGVSYRAFIQQEAAALGLTGYVRNLPGGDVEILAEGEDSAIDELIAAAKNGPPLARVREVKTERSSASSRFARFEIRYD